MRIIAPFRLPFTARPSREMYERRHDKKGSPWHSRYELLETAHIVPNAILKLDQLHSKAPQYL